MLLRDFLTLYHTHHPGVTDGTIEQYAISIGRLRQFLEREPQLADLTTTTIGAYILADKRSGRAARTINNTRQMAITMSRFAVELQLLDRPCATGKLREPKRLPNAMTVDEMIAIIVSCRKARTLPERVSSHHANLWTPLHWECLIRTIWEAGHRLDAMLHCPRAALDARRFLRMPAELTKSQREERHRLSIDLFEKIQQLPAHRLLFPWPLENRAIGEKLDRHILKPAGLPTGRRWKFHCFRRTSASHLWAATKDLAAVMRHLGHRDQQTTMGYIDFSIGGEEDLYACDLLPALAIP